MGCHNTSHAIFSLTLTGTPYRRPSFLEAMVFIWSKLSDKTIVQQFSFLWTFRACNKRQIKYLLCKNGENCLKGKTFKQLKSSPCKEKKPLKHQNIS